MMKISPKMRTRHFGLKKLVIFCLHNTHTEVYSSMYPFIIPQVNTQQVMQMFSVVTIAAKSGWKSIVIILWSVTVCLQETNNTACFNKLLADSNWNNNNWTKHLIANGYIISILFQEVHVYIIELDSNKQYLSRLTVTLVFKKPVSCYT